MAALQRIEVLFSGHVQGVGFRYTALSISRSHVVAGFVRNLADGGVELVAEGEPSEVRAFVDNVKAEMTHYIRNATESLVPATGEFTGFSVRF